MQPLGKKINHATYVVKKITKPLKKKKSCNLLGPKKITKSLTIKKITQPLATKIKNHKTSQDKKYHATS